MAVTKPLNEPTVAEQDGRRSFGVRGELQGPPHRRRIGRGKTRSRVKRLAARSSSARARTLPKPLDRTHDAGRGAQPEPHVIRGDDPCAVVKRSDIKRGRATTAHVDQWKRPAH